MKGRTSAASLGLVGGLALGIWIGSEMTSGREAVSPGPAVVAAQEVETPAATPQPAKPRRVTNVARASLEELRLDEKLDAIPVIVVTSKDLSKAERELLISNKVSSMWQKGHIDREKLIAHIESQLELG